MQGLIHTLHDENTARILRWMYHYEILLRNADLQQTKCCCLFVFAQSKKNCRKVEKWFSEGVGFAATNRIQGICAMSTGLRYIRLQYKMWPESVLYAPLCGSNAPGIAQGIYDGLPPAPQSRRKAKAQIRVLLTLSMVQSLFEWETSPSQVSIGTSLLRRRGVDVRVLANMPVPSLCENMLYMHLVTPVGSPLSSDSETGTLTSTSSCSSVPTSVSGDVLHVATSFTHKTWESSPVTCSAESSLSPPPLVRRSRMRVGSMPTLNAQALQEASVFIQQKQQAMPTKMKGGSGSALQVLHFAGHNVRRRSMCHVPAPSHRGTLEPRCSEELDVNAICI